MIPALGVGRIWLHRGPADLRRSYDGLAGLVQQHFDRSLFSGALFVFVNRRRTQVKILYWCGDGLAIWAKRLERGTFRVPPAAAARAELSTAELSMLLEGITPLRLNRRYRRVPPDGG